MRIALGIEYDGTAYNGWQRQRTGDGIQARVEDALEQVADHSIDVSCAGRTDTGVHASGQVVHFDTTSERTASGWLLGANSNLPDDINVTWASPVDDGFHARFSAIARTYRYLLLNCPVRSSLYRHRAWWIHEPLDASHMHEAAQVLIGKHDFSAFRAAACRASTPVREMHSIAVNRCDDWIEFELTANAFLQHMVRNITGVLVAVGRGDQSLDWVLTLLKSCDRSQGGVAAPPHGLTLIKVDYPEEYDLPQERSLQIFDKMRP